MFRSFVCLCVRVFVCLSLVSEFVDCLFVRLCVFDCLLMCEFTYLFMCSIMCLCACLLVCLCVCAFV